MKLKHTDIVSESFDISEEKSNKMSAIFSKHILQYLQDNSDERTKTEIFEEIINSKEMKELGIDTENILHMTFAGYVFGSRFIQIERDIQKHVKLAEFMEELKKVGQEIKKEAQDSSEDAIKVVH